MMASSSAVGILRRRVACALAVVGYCVRRTNELRRPSPSSVGTPAQRAAQRRRAEAPAARPSASTRGGRLTGRARASCPVRPKAKGAWALSRGVSLQDDVECSRENTEVGEWWSWPRILKRGSGRGGGGGVLSRSEGSPCRTTAEAVRHVFGPSGRMRPLAVSFGSGSSRSSSWLGRFGTLGWTRAEEHTTEMILIEHDLKAIGYLIISGEQAQGHHHCGDMHTTSRRASAVATGLSCGPTATTQGQMD